MKNDLGVLLRRKRHEKGITMKVVADSIGVHHSLISTYEMGKRNPSLRALRKLSEFYEIPYGTLLSLRMDMKDETKVNQKEIADHKKLLKANRHKAILLKALKEIEDVAEQREIKRIVADALFEVEPV